jgi:hypothetical protein
LRWSDEVIQSGIKGWIASRSLSSGGHSPDPLARNDGCEILTLAAFVRIPSRFGGAFENVRGEPAAFQRLAELDAQEA